MKNMDAFILENLEWLFNKISISPYITARVWTVGSYLVWIYTYRQQLFSIHFWTFFIALSVGIGAWAMIQQTLEPERRNILRLDNFVKIDYVWLRICLLIALMISTPLMLSHIEFFVYGFYTVWVFIVHQYLIALEWNPEKTISQKRI